MQACHQFRQPTTRRSLLRTSACGFAHVSLAALAAHAAQPAAIPAALPHRPGLAKRVIFLFMWGGPSHVDLFDSKPLLQQFDGREVSAEAWKNGSPPGGRILGSPFRFRRCGDSGVEISELFPALSRHADRMCVIRSMHTDGSAHGEALLNLHTGSSTFLRPSVGAWISYGLGAESENLPGFVTISPPRGHGGVQNYGSAFLPAKHQATALGAAEIPVAKARISNLGNDRVPRPLQRRQLDLLQSLNHSHLQSSAADAGIEGLISSYELAFRMQTSLPGLLGLEDETPATLSMYGIGEEPTDNFGRQCLLARKLSEQGVRYVQASTDYTWDHHTQNNAGLRRECARVDRPIAALLQDLEQRGLLDETLVIWGSEFGRTPTVENGDGRNHHPAAFSIWMAGGGIRGGLTWGATDDFGFHPVEHPMHMHDLHATILYALGLDHTRLTWRYAGRDFRLTDVHGNPAVDLFRST